ncbi:MAG: hypothetical protein V7724_14860 [Sediminicola sp.]
MSRLLYISLLVLLGLFLSPMDTYACGPHSNSEPKGMEEHKADADTEACCKNGPSEHNDKGCDGKCENPSCHCPTNYFNPILPLNGPLLQDRSFASHSTIYYKETLYAAGFLSVWLPPKIG